MVCHYPHIPYAHTPQNPVDSFWRLSIGKGFLGWGEGGMLYLRGHHQIIIR